jgi:hypothetical protein
VIDSANAADAPGGDTAADRSGRRAAPGGRSAPFTLAGVFFVVAGLGSVASTVAIVIPITADATAASMSNFATRLLLVIVGALGFAIGTAGGYTVLARARFPRPGRAMKAVTIGIALAWLLPPLAAFALALGGLAMPAPVRYACDAIGGVLLLIFALAAARNRLLPTGFRVVPGIQLLLVVVGYVAGGFAALPLPGLSFLFAGAAFIILAAHARAALEAASRG